MKYSIKLSPRGTHYSLSERNTEIAQIAACTPETALKIAAALNNPSHAGSTKSERKATSSKANGTKGGRPAIKRCPVCLDRKPLDVSICSCDIQALNPQPFDTNCTQ